MAALAVAYVLTAELGLLLAFANENVTAVWPPTGLAVAVLVLAGSRFWPGILVGAVVANLLNGAPVSTALAISIGNTLSPLVAATVLRRVGLRPTLERLRDVFALVFAGGVGSMLISASLGTAALALTGELDAGTAGLTWIVWWIGDAMGVVLVAPMILTAACVTRDWSGRKQREAVLLTAMLLVGGWLIFLSDLPLNFLAPIFLILAPAVLALRFLQVGAAAAALVVPGFVILATVSTPLVETTIPITQRLILLQTLNGALALTMLSLGSLMAHRISAERELRAWADELERRVHERTDRLVETQRLARIGSFHWDAVSDENIWSDELYRIYGMEVGVEAPSFATYMSKVHPDHRAEVQAAVERSIRTLSTFDHDYAIVSPTGEERWVHAYGEPIVDGHGQLAGLQGTCQDITERKRAEEAMRSSEERSKALIEKAHDAFVSIGADGVITGWNAAAESVFGWTRLEAIGRKLADTIIPESSRAAHLKGIERFMSSGEGPILNKTIELNALHHDGHEFPIELAVWPVKDGDEYTFCAFARDITQRRSAESSMRAGYERERAAAEHLRALDEAKTTFLEAVSHELRTPLTVIVGVSALLQGGELRTDDEMFPDLLNNLDSSAQRLRQLLDDLLDLDRLGRGVLQPRRQKTHVADLMARVVDALDTGRHEVRVDAHEVVATIDPAQVERIVENLVINTLKHTPAGTPIWVRAEGADGGVLIVVEDSGPGVPDNIRNDLFKPFVKNTREHVSGTGIGLSLVDRFAKLHGGRAWVEDRPGGGSSFRVFLPEKEAETSSSSAA